MLNRDRINGRLQSKHWTMPTYLGAAQREPLDQSLRALIQYVVPTARTVGAENLQRNVVDLCLKYQSVDSSIKDMDEELQLIKAAVKQSHEFCNPDGTTMGEKIASCGLDPGMFLRNKHVRQVEKIGRYWGLCEDMASASRRYSGLFKSIRLEVIPRYQPFTPPVVFPNKAAPCHVHAEVQLLTFYGLNPESVKKTPRVLGVSKAACYLCDLFIFHHERFFISKTHGRLYHQWNVPDLEEFSERQLLGYRHALAMMNDQLQTSLVAEKRRQRRRGYPQESWLALPSGFPTSPLPSSVGTLLSILNSPIASAVTSGTVTPRARFVHPSPRSGNEADDSSINDILDPLYLDGPSPRLPASTNLSLVRSPDPVSRCHTATPTQQRENTSLSTSSITSLELPFQRNFAAMSPIRSRIGNMSLTFETEGAIRGSVAIARTLDNKNPMPASAIDIDALKPSEVQKFAREAETANMVLNLNHSQGQSTQCTLRWL